MPDNDTAPAGARGGLVVAAAMVLSLVLGSIHAFSVFLAPLEEMFGASRAAASMTYSLALVALTVAVLLGHHVYALVRPPVFAGALLALAAAGAAIAAAAPALPLVWLGYSLLFGGANGLGYGYALQASAQANPRRPGLSMGLVTAAYALGAFVSPVLFDFAIGRGGVAAGMASLAGALFVTLPLVAVLLHRSGFCFEIERIGGSADLPMRRQTAVLWLGYGSAVAAGLMAIGHATGIARAAGLSGSLVLAAPMCIAVANMIGSLVGGRLIDRIDSKPVLAVLPAVSGLTLYAMVATGTGPVVLAALALIGFCYGSIIAAYPAAIAAMHGAVAGIRIYGRVFTAWGTAGLFAPWMAGALFDWSGDYRVSLAIAGSLGMASALVIYTMTERKSAKSSIT